MFTSMSKFIAAMKPKIKWRWFAASWLQNAAMQRRPRPGKRQKSSRQMKPAHEQYATRQSVPRRYNHDRQQGASGEVVVDEGPRAEMLPGDQTGVGYESRPVASSRPDWVSAYDEGRRLGRRQFVAGRLTLATGTPAVMAKVPKSFNEERCRCIKPKADAR